MRGGTRPGVRQQRCARWPSTRLRGTAGDRCLDHAGGGPLPALGQGRRAGSGDRLHQPVRGHRPPRPGGPANTAQRRHRISGRQLIGQQRSQHLRPPPGPGPVSRALVAATAAAGPARARSRPAAATTRPPQGDCSQVGKRQRPSGGHRPVVPSRPAAAQHIAGAAGTRPDTQPGSPRWPGCRQRTAPAPAAARPAPQSGPWPPACQGHHCGPPGTLRRCRGQGRAPRPLGWRATARCG